MVYLLKKKMLLQTVTNIIFNFKRKIPLKYGILSLQRCYLSQDLDSKYTDSQKIKILEVINQSDAESLSGYDVTKGKLKKFSQWKNNNGHAKSLSDVEYIDGFTEKSAAKLFNSILEGPPKTVKKTVNKIKGQVLQPTLSETERQSISNVMSVYISVNSVCWTLIDRANYELVKWQYYGIDYPEGKRFQITDIMDIAWKVTHQMPPADVYVMKAEATTLRAAGSDPNNPKVIAVNLQKAQMVAMIVALLNSRSCNSSLSDDGSSEEEFDLKQKVYFLRPTLPYRLYGTLVGNEKVSTDQTVEMLFQNANKRSPTDSHVCIPEQLQNMFKNQKELQQDMLGHSLLLGLTFMDVCIYKNQESINKLANNRS